MIKQIFLAAWSNRTPFRKFLIKHIAQLYFTPWLGHNIIIAKGGFLAFFRWFSFSSWLLHLFNVLTRARVCTTVIWLKNCRKIIHNLIPDGFPTRQARRALEGHQLLKNWRMATIPHRQGIYFPIQRFPHLCSGIWSGIPKFLEPLNKRSSFDKVASLVENFSHSLLLMWSDLPNLIQNYINFFFLLKYS